MTNTGNAERPTLAATHNALVRFLMRCGSSAWRIMLGIYAVYCWLGDFSGKLLHILAVVALIIGVVTAPQWGIALVQLINEKRHAATELTSPPAAQTPQDATAPSKAEPLPKLAPMVPEPPKCVSEQPAQLVERISKDATKFNSRYRGRTLCEPWTLVVQWAPEKLESGLWRVWVGRNAIDGPQIEIETRSNLSAVRTDDKVRVEGMLWHYAPGTWILHPLGKFKMIDAKVWKVQ